jgi:hypothetical protein
MIVPQEPYQPKTKRAKILYYSVLIAIMAVLTIAIGIPMAQTLDTYGYLGPRVHYGYITDYGDHWIWLAPQTDHELLYGNFTLAKGVSVPSWVNNTYGFPASFTIDWGEITNLNPY